MSFKKCKVVMLPTNEKSNIVMNNIQQGLFVVGGDGILAKHRMGDCTNQHLYFLSDEEIKEGDYVLYHEDKISQVLGINIDELKLDRGGVWRNSCKKIISTTDNSLEKICEYESGTWLRLPQPSTSFIEKFVEEYNKGNVITEVLVEYEKYIGKNYVGEFTTEKDFDYKLKINPKDNRIIIRKVRKFSEYVTDDLLKKAQKAILCNQKDAIMNENYILEYLQQYDRDL